jgi:hypothetical protein
MVARYEHELSDLRDEVAAARAELHEVKGDLRRVLAILDKRAEADSRFWDHGAAICAAFANDGKVRLVLVAGVVLLGLVLAGVTGLSYRDGALTVDASENQRRVGQDAAPLP